MQRDSVANTFLVAGLLCLVCSFLVSATAVGLRPLQEANKRLEMRKNILQVAGIYDPSQSVDELFKQIETRLVDLTDPQNPVEVDDPKLLETYDPRKALSDPELSVPFPEGGKLEGFKRRGKYAFVYLVKKNGKLDEIILPIYGKGLWSTLYGFIALDADFRTIRGLGFYEHGETPGLGGEVDNPHWKALWNGKKAYDENGEVAIAVIKGAVPPNDPAAEYKVDGLSGATFTSKGVSRLVRYWLGDYGFGPYLRKLREELGHG
ncbi:MAG: Na(+)-translocating NADH-quinone reductase subunit C [Planctomycetes bacterium]|nr:Na(+)-translocating NADH-quinone reductase subunit C [Planctomycetota bacterium]